jgi:hypothetical protein
MSDEEMPAWAKTGCLAIMLFLFGALALIVVIGLILAVKASVNP